MSEASYSPNAAQAGTPSAAAVGDDGVWAKIPPSRSIRLVWKLDKRSRIDYRQELMDQCAGVQRVYLYTAPLAAGASQLAIINFHDLRDAQSALAQWHGRQHWGVRIEGHHMVPSDPVRHRTPCSAAISQGSLRIELQSKSAPLDPLLSAAWLQQRLAEFGELRSFELVEEESRRGLLVAFVEFFDVRARLQACTKLNQSWSKDAAFYVQLAWDQSSMYASSFFGAKRRD
ncbi:hypothetical protein H9P43_002016 [Blastocladiella emersonii ATCC 22665]|nr:hypothetical protein H9P43_002016 [Blastocladiella emersonii ATCC 22665]